MTNQERAKGLYNQILLWRDGAAEELLPHLEAVLGGAVAEEREACAKLADEDVNGDGKHIAAAIRARGE